MSDDIAIKVDNVSKTFRLPHEKNDSVKSAVINFYRRSHSFEEQEVLKDISFDIKKGEFFGIVGRNGSGKSTLLKMLAGIYSPSKGNITINGKLTPFIELGVGFNPELTGRENVYLNGALLGFNRKEMRKMYRDIVEFAELRKFMDQKLKNYSSGMQVRLAFSIAIRAKSDILVLDEVLAVGDEAFQKKCEEYFLKIKNSGKTVILVTHSMKSVTEYCDRAMLLHDGEIKFIKDPQSVSEAYNEINQIDPNDSSQDLDAYKDSISDGAKIESIKIGSDKSNSWFQYGETVTIEVKYKLHANVKKAIIDIGVRLGENGPYYFYTTSEKHEMEVSGKKGSVISLQCKFKNIFRPGTFYVATSLYDAKSLKVYARERNGAKFRTGELPADGLVYPDHQLKIEDK